MSLKDIIRKKNILVFGDLMLDIYYKGIVKRISPEAPIPVLLKKEEERILGGAANVAANLIAANQNVDIISVIGDDYNGEIIVDLLKNIGVNCSLLFRSKSRTTTTKTRLMGQNNQQIVRLDEEENFFISRDEENKILNELDKCIEKYDVIIISDYLKGVVTEKICKYIIDIAKSNSKKVLIDVKDTNLDKYKGAYLLKPNQKELNLLTGCEANTKLQIIDASKKLCREACCEYVLTTCGSRGMVLVENNDKYKVIDSMAKSVYDVSGAGDTVISYLAVCLANNLDIVSSITVANDAAGIKVSKVGTAPVFLDELINYYGQNRQNNNIKKIVNRDEIVEILKNRNGKKVVFTNGCFDILHYGHIKYLNESSKKGDILIVGLNSDESVRRLKGVTRPINNQNDRSNILAALEFVDYVIIFNEETPKSLIELIKPNILVKGADYKPEEVVGKNFVESYGGKVELIPFIENRSTSNIISKILGDN